MIGDEVARSASAWDSARDDQIRRWAALSLREVLEALQEMEQLSERLRPPREAAASPVDPETSHR